MSDFHPRNVYVAGLPQGFPDTALQAIFEPYGKITSAKMMRHNCSGKGKGIGFVLFESETSSVAAIREVGGRILEGETLVVRRARISKPPAKQRVMHQQLLQQMQQEATKQRNLEQPQPQPQATASPVTFQVSQVQPQQPQQLHMQQRSPSGYLIQGTGAGTLANPQQLPPTTALPVLPSAGPVVLQAGGGSSATGQPFVMFQQQQAPVVYQQPQMVQQQHQALPQQSVNPVSFAPSVALPPAAPQPTQQWILQQSESTGMIDQSRGGGGGLPTAKHTMLVLQAPLA